MRKSLNQGISIWMLLVLIFTVPARADEGMWLPLLLNKNLDEMQRKGLKLSAEDIYSVNNASLKDAIVKFGSGFCTGEVISSEGLVLTNHHCGYSYIQMHSTLENDILSNGFWAKTKQEEIPNPGLSVSILQRMEDVTSQVLEGITNTTPERERETKISSAIKKLVDENKKEKYNTVNVKEFFDGNAYYMFVYNTYSDVRLVGTPPNSIGKFGGDTDNWMWPRHTGDFSMFRIYTAADGTPAEFSKENIPLKPKHFLPISLKGVKENDYAMVMGFPGSTDRYLTSYGVKFNIETYNPTIVKLRDHRLNVWRADMKADKKIRLQYASKFARVANYWKYFQGQTEQLQRLNVTALKQKQEAAFTTWVNEDASRKAQYGTALSTLEKNYAGRKDVYLPLIYYGECINAVELLAQSARLVGLRDALKEGKDATTMVQGLTMSLDDFYKDYSPSTDKKLLAVMLQRYEEDMPESAKPAYFKNTLKKSKGDYSKAADMIFSKSLFADRSKMEAFLKSPNAKALESDPAFQMAAAFSELIGKIRPAALEIGSEAKIANRKYVAGTMELYKDRKFYPNANSTLRVTYGQILPYEAKDAVNFHYLTSEKGILEKEIPGDLEFDVPAKLKTLIQNKDFGPYGENGSLPVNFLSNNDITGGNSGSPVINAEGHLIGTAFDGNWEAMSGDISFEPVVQRTISVDIRYTLFIIDKFAGATHLIEEMKIIR